MVEELRRSRMGRGRGKGDEGGRWRKGERDKEKGRVQKAREEVREREG